MNPSVPRFSPALLTLLVAAVVVGSFFFYTWSNDFSLMAHADEKKKVAQILDRSRNFNHPLLLLSTTQLLSDWQPGAATPESVARVGRGVAAGLMALAVGFFVLLAHRRAGAVAAVIAAIFLLSVPMLFELGHFFKEDPALLFGVALSLWLLDRALEKSTLSRWMLVGLGCAVAASGKYLGALLLLAVLVFLLVVNREKKLSVRFAWLAALLGVFFLSFAAFNFELIRALPAARKSFQKEITKVRDGGAKGARKVPHKDYLNTIKRNLPLPIVALAVTGAWLAFRRGRTGRFEQGILLLTIVWLLLLSFSPKVAPRYALPVISLLAWLAAVGVAHLWGNSLSRWGRGVVFLLVLSALGLQARPLAATVEGFTTNNRDDLVRWLLTNTQPEEKIAQDDRVALEHQPEFRSRKVLGSHYVADLGSVEDLRANGVRWVVVNDGNLVLFEKRAANEGNDPRFVRRREFYQTLQKQKRALILKESAVSALNPGLVLFDLQNPFTSAELPALEK